MLQTEPKSSLDSLKQSDSDNKHVEDPVESKHGDSDSNNDTGTTSRNYQQQSNRRDVDVGVVNGTDTSYQNPKDDRRKM
tara:strand:- start:454 stop:690 length:237 start_codon:yes stop_codon:yes gene_type:complete